MRWRLGVESCQRPIWILTSGVCQNALGTLQHLLHSYLSQRLREVRALGRERFDSEHTLLYNGRVVLVSAYSVDQIGRERRSVLH